MFPLRVCTVIFEERVEVLDMEIHFVVFPIKHFTQDVFHGVNTIFVEFVESIFDGFVKEGGRNGMSD
jgi:hypothetical protein